MVASTAERRRLAPGGFWAMRFVSSFGSLTRSKYSSSAWGEKRRTYFAWPVRIPEDTKPRCEISDTTVCSGAFEKATPCSGRPMIAGGSGTGMPHGLEDGGQDVGERDHLRDSASRRPAARELDEDGNVNQLVEDGPAVQPAVVVLELLAVVADEEDQGVVVDAALSQAVDEPAELLVAVGDVAVVLRDEALAIERLLEVVRGSTPGVPGSRLRIEHRVEGRGR